MALPCMICGGKTDKACCLQCEKKIKTKYEIYRSPLYGVLGYNDTVRELIHLGKISNNLRSIQFIKDLLSESEMIHKICAEGRIIKPLPGSVWGRMHWRVDLAYIIASHLNDLHPHLKLLKSKPNWSRWFKKQAQDFDRKLVDELDWPDEDPHTIYIDDVMTSGQTLLQNMTHPSRAIVLAMSC